MIDITEVLSSNGVTDVIDTVLMPPLMSGGSTMMNKTKEKMSLLIRLTTALRSKAVTENIWNNPP